MQFNLHDQYAKAVAAPPVEREHVNARAGRAKAPPGPVRSRAAVALASAARRLDGEAARRAAA